MIYTITFNPALDITGVVENLIPNEKSYVTNVIHTAGGNGINAGIIAARLGTKVRLTGFVGGDNGNQLKALLDQQKLDHNFVSIHSNTRMNVTVSNRSTHKQTRLSFPGPKITAGEWKDLIAVLGMIKSGDLVIIGGSLPPGVSALKVASIVRSLNKREVRCVVDMPAVALGTVLKAKPYLIKPNLQEFQELTKTKAVTIKEVLKAAKNLQNQVHLICVSSVEGGALLIGRGEVWFGKTPKLSIKSTVGAGDSMVGAMASMLALVSDAPLADMLRTGLAASSASLSEPGLTLGSKKSIKSFISKIRIREI